MARFIFKRLVIVLVTLWLLSIVVLFLPRIGPGDPVNLLLPNDASEEDREALREELGLNKPLIVQYGIFLGNAVQGDFGESIYLKEPVTSLIADRFPNTLRLATVTFLIVVPLGIMMGVLAAIRRGKAYDAGVRSFAVLGQSMPNFWVGIMLILLFAVTWNLLPTSGMGSWNHYVLPVITLGWVTLASVMRLTRTSML